MRILHTEASNGWGGQEIRILREAEGMRKRGHEVFFAIVKGGQLVVRAREAGFIVCEFLMDKQHALSTLYQLICFVRKERIEIINTHSSYDAWWAGLAGRLSGVKVIRTRHISTKIRAGFNAFTLYRLLADRVVTTCESTAEIVRQMTGLCVKRCSSIPTGIDQEQIKIDECEIVSFREKYGLRDQDCIAGTACVLRSWKGLMDIIHAAKALEYVNHLKWLIVGSGSMENLLKEECIKLGLQEKVIFTGYLETPFSVISSMDIFLLLSTANEGVSQASLQAGYLKKPLITTEIGGLPEVCIDQQTGFVVSLRSPLEVAEKVLCLTRDPQLRQWMGNNAQKLVLEKFTFEKTLDQMEAIYFSF